MNGPALLSIGEVAKATGLAVSAIRYYDEMGLAPATTRVGGKRRFTVDTVARVSFVQRCQEAGFSLEEIGSILDDSAGGWAQLVDAKLVELVAHRDQLDQMISLLNHVRSCGCRVVAECERYPTCD